VLNDNFQMIAARAAGAHFGAGEGDEYFDGIIDIYTVEP
jgi:hypothetical protein